MLKTSSPEIDYFAPEVFSTLAFSQIARAGDTVYLSGVAPLKGGLTDMVLVGEGDMAAQVAFVLRVIDDCLKSEGLSRKNLASWTFYTTDITGFMTALEAVIGPWLGDHHPCSTTIAVSGFVHPAQLVEITAIAVIS